MTGPTQQKPMDGSREGVQPEKNGSVSPKKFQVEYVGFPWFVMPCLPQKNNERLSKGSSLRRYIDVMALAGVTLAGESPNETYPTVGFCRKIIGPEKCQSVKGYACSQKGPIFVDFFVSPYWSVFFLSSEMVRNQVLVGGKLGLATIDSDLIGAS